MYTLFELDEGRIQKTAMEEMNFHRTKWLDLQNPTENELSHVSSITSISTQQLLSYVDPNEVTRIEEQEHYTVIIFKSSGERKKSETDRSTTSLAFLVSPNLIITLHHGNIPTFTESREQPERLLEAFKKGTSELLYYFMDIIMKRYFKTLDQIEDEITKIEDVVFNHTDQKTVKKIFKLKRTLVYFQKALSSNREVFVTLQKEYEKIDPTAKNKITHLYYDAAQLIEVIATYRDILTGSLDIYLTSVNNNLNAVMKKMAAYGTIVLVPTFITGLYGMNFEHIPELTWKYGYAFAWLVIILSVTGLTWYFRKNDWF